MKIKDITTVLEEWAPLAYAEDFDNVGLLVGHPEQEIHKILVAHDTLESTIDEAIAKQCNLIISYHPIIFGGLKKINGKSYVERVVQKALKNDIAIYALHTALDNCFTGMNAMICKKLGVKNRRILLPQKGTIQKLVTYVPKAAAGQLRKAIFKAGGGTIGNYDECSFNVEGRGSYKGNKDAHPVIGKRGELHFEEETQLNITFPKHKKSAILQALFEAHPYEEVAYEITQLENNNQHVGIGMVGELDSALPPLQFIEKLKKIFHLKIIRHTRLPQKSIKSVAVLGGSGAFGIEAAKNVGADIYITGDLKYHDFFKAEDKIVLADIGHYETEQFTKDLIDSFLKEKFPNFAILVTELSSNPIQYT